MKLVYAAAGVAALAIAGSAAAIPMDVTHPQTASTIESDGPSTTDTTPTPTPTTTGDEGCPSTAISQEPNPACPPEPSESDDQGNPVPCNYYSGVPSEPCPHADGDYWIAKCTDESIVHVLRDAPDSAADVLCPDGYTVLDR